MARDSDHRADDFETENTGGLLSGFLAEEEEFDRRALWRIGSWGVGAVGAVVVAVMANQSAIGWRRDQVAAADLTRQAQQIQVVARESQSEARRLASAIDTLNGDRDRLYSRVSTLEQGLDSVTGAIARQTTAAASPSAAPAPSAKAELPAAPSSLPAPAVASVSTTKAATTAAEKPAAVEKPPVAVAGEASPATGSSVAQDLKQDASKADIEKTDPAKIDAAKTSSARIDTVKPPSAMSAIPLVASKWIMAPPDPAAGKLIEPTPPESVVTAVPIPEVMASAPLAASEAEADDATAPKAALQRTEFGIDLGNANSVSGLRALWRVLLKSKSNAPLAALRPIIVVKEGNSGMQLRLVAGPLNDAGAAAKICAVLAENGRACETTIFDGQRLTMKVDDAPPTSTKPAPRRRSAQKHAAAAAAVEEPPKKPEASTISSWFGRKDQ